MSLRIFPPTTVNQPRRSSVKKPTTSGVALAPGELTGFAIELETSPTSGVVQPANQQIRHSFFCEPSANLLKSPRRQRSIGHGSASSARPLLRSDAPETIIESPATPIIDRSQAYEPARPSGARSSPHLKRPSLPQLVSTEAQRGSEVLPSPGGDELSPLPTKTCFETTAPRKKEHPAPRSLRAGSPTMFRDDSPASTVPPYSPGFPAPVRSIFPQYDPSKALDQQQYYPVFRPAPRSLPSEKISKQASPVDKKVGIGLEEIPAAVVEGYEHIPVADSNDALALYSASCGSFPVPGRKLQLGLFQPSSRDTSLALGTSPDSLLYSMEKSLSSTPADASKKTNELMVKKHCPGKAFTSAPVAQLALPDPAKESDEPDKEVISIFPQMAAIKAIEIVSNSPAASAIASFDPEAVSPEAQQLGQEAVAEAYRRYRCELVRSTRKRDSLGAVTATYKLVHPTLGAFPITITKSTFGRHSRDPRAKISLHHPSATLAAVTAETLVLAFLDFSRNAAVLDVPGLLALEAAHVIDTIVCALLAVAVIENDALVAETLTFDAPPTAALAVSKHEGANCPSNTSKRRTTGLFRRKKSKDEPEHEQVELPILTQGALALLGLSFKTTVFVLEVGVKASAGVILGLSHVAKKL